MLNTKNFQHLDSDGVALNTLNRWHQYYHRVIEELNIKYFLLCLQHASSPFYVFTPTPSCARHYDCSIEPISDSYLTSSFYFFFFFLFYVSLPVPIDIVKWINTLNERPHYIVTQTIIRILLSHDPIWKSPRFMATRCHKRSHLRICAGHPPHVRHVPIQSIVSQALHVTQLLATLPVVVHERLCRCWSINWR